MSYRGPGSLQQMDDLSELLIQIASHGHRVAIVHDGESLSYIGLMHKVSFFAEHLLTNGFGETRPLATALPNGKEQLIVHLGAFLASVPLIRLRPTAPPPQLHHCLKTIQTHGLIASDEILESIDEEYHPEILIRLDWFDNLARTSSFSPEGEGKMASFPKVSENQIACVTFTSGTTARPKGVIHSRRAVANAIKRTIDILEYSPDDVVFVRMALYAQIGMIVQALPALVVGAMVELSTLDPVGAYRNAFRTEPKKTLLFDAPSILSDLMRTQEVTGIGMDRLRAIWAGGDFITPRIQARTFAISGRYILVGFPLPDTEIRIVDDYGKILACNQKGHIQVKTSSSFDGYWNLPDLTKSVLGPDGWISTGDIGKIDDTGKLHLLGRHKEMIVINGFKVAPIEVETVLLSHPGVQHSVVVGTDTGDGQVKIEAFVILREGFEPCPSREDLLELASERLEKFMVPSEVYFVRRLPYFPTGKIDRERLMMISLAGLWEELL